MAEEDESLVNLTIIGKDIFALSSLSVIIVLWQTGYPHAEHNGCLEGGAFRAVRGITGGN